MESRTAAQIREHYEIEKDIAQRLRQSTLRERQSMYNEAYNELFRKVSHHPLLHNDSQTENQNRIAKEILNLQRFLTKNTTYLEVGPGDCAIAFEVAKQVKKVYAIDVSDEVTKKVVAPSNFELIISNGTEIPVPLESVDFAYSNQLMEHLHAEDSRRQLENIFRALKPNGIYFCITPNRLSGPHDISRNFDDTATGLHLKEFTVSELDDIFKEVGFSKTKIYLRYREIDVFLPILIFRIAEKLLDIVPHKLRKMLTFNKVVRFLLGVKMIGEK
jgi:ubiquinone/menaquinone biosynthesis C-methylase UbiE